MSEFECIEVYNKDDISVVKIVDEKVIDTERIARLGKELLSLADNDAYQRVVINMDNVRFLSSSAINKLIVLERRITDQGRLIKISNLSPEVEEVFNITQLNTVFDIRDDEDDAVEAYNE